MIERFFLFKKSFFIKQMGIYLLLVFFLVIIIGVVSNSVFLSRYKEQTLEYYVSSLKQLNTDLDSNINKISAVVQLLYVGYNENSSLIYDLIEESRGREINNINQMQKFYILSNYIKDIYKGINSIFIVTNKGRILYDGRNSYVSEYNFLEKDWFKEIETQKGRDLFIQDKNLKKDYLYGAGNLNLLTFGKNIINPDELWDKKPIATLLINIDSTFFKNIIKQYDINTYSDVYILNSSGKVLYNKNNLLVDTQFDFNNKLQSRKKDGEVFSINANGKKQIVYHFTSNTSKWTYLVLIPENELSKGSNTLRFYFILIFFAVILIGIFISSIFARQTSSRIKKILEAMVSVENGNLDVKVEIKTGDELGLISKGLNDMVGKIKQYISDIYKTEAMKREAELYALKSQTDAHFLFNILEVIRMRILINGDKETAEMVKILGKFYQSKLNYGENLIALGDELDLVNKYIDLEKYRRNEKIILSVDIQKEFYSCKIPVFSFQPIIENVLKHGIKKDSDIEIIIKAVRIDDKLEITISDNGKGIEYSKVEEINKELGEKVIIKSHKHIGIKNVNYRMKLHFGIDFGITMESIYGEGTCVRFYLPINGEENSICIKS